MLYLYRCLFLILSVSGILYPCMSQGSDGASSSGDCSEVHLFEQCVNETRKLIFPNNSDDGVSSSASNSLKRGLVDVDVSDAKRPRLDELGPASPQSSVSLGMASIISGKSRNDLLQMTSEEIISLYLSRTAFLDSNSEGFKAILRSMPKWLLMSEQDRVAEVSKLLTSMRQTLFVPQLKSLLAAALDCERQNPHKCVFYHATDSYMALYYDIITAYRSYLDQVPLSLRLLLRGLESGFKQVQTVGDLKRDFLNKNGTINNYKKSGNTNYADVAISVNLGSFGSDGQELSSSVLLFARSKSVLPPNVRVLLDKFLIVLGFRNRFVNFEPLFEEYGKSNGRLYQIFSTQAILDEIGYLSLAGGVELKYGQNDHSLSDFLREFKSDPRETVKKVRGLLNLTGSDSDVLSRVQGRLLLHPHYFHNGSSIQINTYDLNPRGEDLRSAIDSLVHQDMIWFLSQKIAIPVGALMSPPSLQLMAMERLKESGLSSSLAPNHKLELSEILHLGNSNDMRSFMQINPEYSLNMKIPYFSDHTQRSHSIVEERAPLHFVMSGGLTPDKKKELLTVLLELGADPMFYGEASAFEFFQGLIQSDFDVLAAKIVTDYNWSKQALQRIYSVSLLRPVLDVFNAVQKKLGTHARSHQQTMDGLASNLMRALDGLSGMLVFAKIYLDSNPVEMNSPRFIQALDNIQNRGVNMVDVVSLLKRANGFPDTYLSKLRENRASLAQGQAAYEEFITVLKNEDQIKFFSPTHRLDLFQIASDNGFDIATHFLLVLNVLRYPCNHYGSDKFIHPSFGSGSIPLNTILMMLRSGVNFTLKVQNSNQTYYEMMEAYLGKERGSAFNNQFYELLNSSADERGVFVGHIADNLEFSRFLLVENPYLLTKAFHVCGAETEQMLCQTILQVIHDETSKKQSFLNDRVKKDGLLEIVIKILSRISRDGIDDSYKQTVLRLILLYIKNAQHLDAALLRDVFAKVFFEMQNNEFRVLGQEILRYAIEKRVPYVIYSLISCGLDHKECFYTIKKERISAKELYIRIKKTPSRNRAQESCDPMIENFLERAFS